MPNRVIKCMCHDIRVLQVGKRGRGRYTARKLQVKAHKIAAIDFFFFFYRKLSHSNLLRFGIWADWVIALAWPTGNRDYLCVCLSVSVSGSRSVSVSVSGSVCGCVEWSSRSRLSAYAAANNFKIGALKRSFRLVGTYRGGRPHNLKVIFGLESKNYWAICWSVKS